jgi:CheY-like chemotaxis protein
MPQNPSKHVRVLAVDDSPAFLSTLCSFFQDDPVFDIVATAYNGRDALSAVERYRPHVVLMDLQMPEMNGLEATTEIRKRFPEIPVIILTGHDLPILREACKESGAYAVLTKAQLGREVYALLIASSRGCED